MKRMVNCYFCYSQLMMLTFNISSDAALESRPGVGCHILVVIVSNGCHHCGSEIFTRNLALTALHYLKLSMSFIV
ncbi:hypothetical protein BLOT_007782 [Blomia tropicalis]|nr:hypothetical protein BLOT_007782 [Blomia tropicalis]